MPYYLIILLSDYHNSCWPETEGLSAVSFPTSFLCLGHGCQTHAKGLLRFAFFREIESENHI